MAYYDLRNRSPKVEILPDLRQRLTRVYDVLNEVPKIPTAGGVQPGLSTLLIPWGTADATYTNLRLVKQDISGQFDENGNVPTGPDVKPPTLTRVYETIPATAEIEVGQVDITIDQDDLTECTEHFLQFSKAVAGVSPSYQVPGVSAITAPNGVTCVLKEEVRTDDGTLARIDRHYISKGLISQDTQTKFDGALTLLTQTWVNDPQTPPSGYTLIDEKIDHPNGLPVYTYTWAQGTGQIGLNTDYDLSDDQGATGLTITTIDYISTPLIDDNPTTGPSGSKLVTVGYKDQDGYRIWTAIYVNGTGTVTTDIEKKDGHHLILTTITAINTAPSAPSPSIGGTLVLIKTDVRKAKGYVIYEYTWAEGQGMIGEDIEYDESVNQGTAGITRTTIRFLVTEGATVQPTSLSGSILVGQDYEDSDGYRIWTTRWAKGTGTVDSSIDIRYTDESNDAHLVLYRIVAIGASPASPSATIGGTVVLISTDIKVENGITRYDFRWAEGEGVIDTETELKEGGLLVLYRITSLGVAPTIPDPTIGGTVTAISTDVKNQDGYVLYDYRWAEGLGVVSTQIEYRLSPDQGTTGITTTTIKQLSDLSVTDNPITGPVGAELIAITNEFQDGYQLWTGMYASGQGTVLSKTEYRYADGSHDPHLVIYNLTAINAPTDAPDPTIGGTVVLISAEQRNGTRVEDGTIIYDYTWAEGEGLITDEFTISQLGALVVYHRVSLGVAPTTPSAKIGGTVTAFEQNVRNETGYQIFDYRYAEGHGQAGITTRGEPDGAVIYEVTDLSVGASTPAYPGSGTAYLIELEQVPREGHFLNKAVWKLPPASQDFSKSMDFDMPGQVEETSPDPGYVLVPGNARMLVLATVTVDYDVSQITDVPFTVAAWVGFSESYVVASTGLTVTRQWGMGGYLSGGFSITGGAATYNNVAVSSYTLIVASSTPSAPPSGSTVIHTSNDPYLVDITGTVVYRRTKAVYSF